MITVKTSITPLAYVKSGFSLKVLKSYLSYLRLGTYPVLYREIRQVLKSYFLYRIRLLLRLFLRLDVLGVVA